MADPAHDLRRIFFPSRFPTTTAPLLLLNWLATTTEIWLSLLPRLEAATSVVCLDDPGYGRSLPDSLDALWRNASVGRGFGYLSYIDDVQDDARLA